MDQHLVIIRYNQVYKEISLYTSEHLVGSSKRINGVTVKKPYILSNYFRFRPKKF